MRVSTLVVLLVASALSSRTAAAGTAPTGALTVEAGSGVISVSGSGGLLGRVASGSVVVVDRSPNDPWRWWLDGKERGRRAALKGVDLSFRILGGDYRLIVRGDGISISARGRGVASILGAPGPTGLTGSYSTDLNADCQTVPDTCAPIPTVHTRVTFGPAVPPQHVVPAARAVRLTRIALMPGMKAGYDAAADGSTTRSTT